jgi:hypothetical protein
MLPYCHAASAASAASAALVGFLPCYPSALAAFLAFPTIATHAVFDALAALGVMLFLLPLMHFLPYCPYGLCCPCCLSPWLDALPLNENLRFNPISKQVEIEGTKKIIVLSSFPGIGFSRWDGIHKTSYHNLKIVLTLGVPYLNIN